MSTRPVTRPIKRLTPEEQAARDAEAKRKQEEWTAKMEQQARDAVPNRIAELRQELASLEGMQAMFPDLRRYKGRWEKVAYYSKQANTQVTGFDQRHNCGCCNDSPLEIWPYLETLHGKVYSDPPSIQVGEAHHMGGDRPYPDWQTRLRDAQIPESIVEAIAQHFKKSREDRIAAASDEEPYEEPEPLL